MIEKQIINEIRKQFPITNNIIFLNHAAVAPIHNLSVQAINEFLNYLLCYGDKNYVKWFKKSEEIRAKLASFINASSNELAFIKNTSEGISIVANGLDFISGDNIIIPDIEFPANIYPWMNLQNKGVSVRFLKTQNGCINLNDINDLIDKNTKVVSISSVEFSSGFKSELKQLATICNAKSQQYGRKIYLNVDAIQSLGALKIDVSECNIDFLSADGHKWFLTPEGAGIFYCKQENLDSLYPSQVGWKSVVHPLDFTNIHFDLEKSAKKFESGSLNMPGIMALGASVDLFNNIGIANIENRILHLSKFLSNALIEKGYKIFGSIDDKHRSGIVSFKGDKESKEIVEKLISNSVQVALRGEYVRVSPHFYNTKSELETLISLL